MCVCVCVGGGDHVCLCVGEGSRTCVCVFGRGITCVCVCVGGGSRVWRNMFSASELQVSKTLNEKHNFN